MKINYCPECGNDVVSHFKINVYFASYNQFFCIHCNKAFEVSDEGSIPEEIYDQVKELLK